MLCRGALDVREIIQVSNIKKVYVFYSWQSDSPKKTNQNAIRTALGKAAKKISADRSGIKIIIDEATRDTSGSPNIPSTILEKIQESEIFIADITTITPLGLGRPCPNPNVTYELGYAIGELGWDRVVLLFNKALGEFPKDLPFDFAQHRVSVYQFAKDEDSKTAQESLEQILKMAIIAVLDKNPKRTAELRGLSREKLEHDHDVENMNWLMSAIHLPTLDQHISDMPHSISARALWFWENFRGVVANSLFSLYDPALKDAVDRLFFAWGAAVSHGEQYEETGGDTYIFTSPGDMPLRGDRQQIWDEIENARTEMRRALDQILERLRESYIEVNVRKANAKAWKEYIDVQREMRERYGDDDNVKTKKRNKKS